jgi:hypothetical protein
VRRRIRGGTLTGGAAGSSGFDPYDLQTAPPGSYDPALDYGLENEGLGYLFAGQDFATGRQRLDTDWANTQADIATARDRGLADLLTGRTQTDEDYTLGNQRRQADFDLGRGRLAENRQFDQDDRQLQYQRLASQQTQQARAAGLGEGGALAQALQKRTANQAREQSRADVGFGRQEQDMNLSFSRGNEDATRAYNRYVQGNDLSRSRLLEDTGRQTERGQLGYQRGVTDLETGWQRAGLSHQLFGQQTEREKLNQARQLGALPEKPSNEFSDSKGPYRIEIHNGQRWKRRPDGSYTVVGKAGK